MLSGQPNKLISNVEVYIKGWFTLCERQVLEGFQRVTEITLSRFQYPWKR